MRRIGTAANLIGRIVEWGNISHSIDVVLRGRQRKRLRSARYIMANRDKVIARLQDEIGSGRFALRGYREFVVTDGVKERRVQSVGVLERIGCNAIMHVVEEELFKRYIRTTGASIATRGMHDLKMHIEQDLRADPEGTRYCYKCDVRKFYESIGQDVMMDCLRKTFKDKVLLTMFGRFVTMMPSGLSIGLRSSQCFGNLLLSVELDHPLKDGMGVKHYYRYCDDIVVLDGDKQHLWDVRNAIVERTSAIGLAIKPDERVFPTSDGIDFLGYVIYPDHARLRKRNKQRAARRLKQVKSKRRRKEIEASFYGQCKHGDCRNLFRTITGKTMTTYKRLGELGIHAKFADGKKRFDGAEVNLSELVGEEFLIVDFETGVVTRPQRREYEEKVERQRRELETFTTHGVEPPKGFLYPEAVKKPEGKYLVSIRRHPDSAQETVQKLFTGDSENKSILDQMREQDLLGRVLVGVKMVRCKGYNRYIFT